MERSAPKLLFCAGGIYASFLTWALVQEPLNTRVWPNSGSQFQAPGVIAAIQAVFAMLVGMAYIRWKGSNYKPSAFIQDYKKELALISFTQSTSTPLATFSLQYVDYLTYMLAKSCKLIPVLSVHLLLYRTPISRTKKLVALLVSAGVAIFTLGGSKGKSIQNDTPLSITGFGFLALSLFLDGMTNATQDELLRKNRERQKIEKENAITGAHLMFALNLFIILYNLVYLGLIDRSQVLQTKSLVASDPEILRYLIIYAFCGAVGQCFIFFTLEEYGSLVLVLITVTRKMISMLLSIVVFGKKVNTVQWLGILAVFGGISWEALAKRSKPQKPKSQ